MRDSSTVVFAHEKLDVYDATLNFVALAHRIIRKFGRGKAELSSQLERAAISIALNTSEGSGEFSPKEKARFYRMALRSAAECSTIIDLADRLDVIQQPDLHEAKILLTRIAAMLHAMTRQQESR